MRADPLRRATRTAAWGILLLAAAAAPGAADPAPAFRIYVEESGVYRVTYEELRQAGLAGGVDPRALALTQGGDEVPIWVEGGDDGRFSPGDHIEFVGEHLRGRRSYYNEYTRLNVYRLTVGAPGGRRMSTPPVLAGQVADAPAPWVFEQHLEKDNFKEVFARPRADAPELWFWSRLTHVDPEPFSVPLQFRSYLADPRRPVSLAIQLQGWSTAASGIESLRDHRLEVYFNGALVGADEWDGEVTHLFEAEVPADLARRGENVLEFKVPERRPPAEPAGDPIIDAVMLNWIEVRHRRGFRIGSSQIRLALDSDAEAAGSPAWARLTTAPGARVTVYGAGGSRFDRRNMVIQDRDDRSSHDLYPPAGESVLWAVPEGTLRSPVAVEPDIPSDLRDRSLQADYIVITHPRLRRAIEPLAVFHRRRGLTVTIIGVDHIYDEFSHSILDPEAIRDFLSYAYHHWRRPAPRFVLLVGDASWQPERSLLGTEAAGGVATAAGGERGEETDPPPPHNLVPSGTYESLKGHAASDNFFVSVAGEDHLPDMAIGRIPATEPEQVAAVVAKTLRYASEPVVGPWRRQILWVSSASRALQEDADAAVGSVAERGFELRKLYPSDDVEANQQSQEGLLQALDRGQLLVHFLGHGGRYIWRTGVTSYQTTLDLFTVDHLAALAPNPRLPLILSMTCFNGAFDDPIDDSFGERLLFLPDRGAVAFFGASWKIVASAEFSELLVEELTSTATGTIGEAIQRAKRRVETRPLVATYNLLGDPALELALPELALEVTAHGGDGEGWTIAATVPGGGFAGHAVVDWLDGDGGVVYSDELEVHGATLTAAGPSAGEAVAAVRVYVWSEEAGIDGIGALRLAAESGSPAG